MPRLGLIAGLKTEIAAIEGAFDPRSQFFAAGGKVAGRRRFAFGLRCRPRRCGLWGLCILAGYPPVSHERDGNPKRQDTNKQAA